MFTTYPTYSPYRTLVHRKAQMHGEDVYALQLGINAILGSHLVSDGVLGPKTSVEIWAVQKRLGEFEDGKAGPLTQRAIVLEIAALSDPAGVIVTYLLIPGILGHESSFKPGNYSAQRPPVAGVVPRVPGGDYDAGVAQMNTQHHDPAEAFNPAQAIPFLIAHTRTAYDSFSDKSKFRGADHSERRRWTLAGGAWNAPAYARYYAGVPQPGDPVPGPTASATFEEYMADITVDLP